MMYYLFDVSNNIILCQTEDKDEAINDCVKYGCEYNLAIIHFDCKSDKIFAVTDFYMKGERTNEKT